MPSFLANAGRFIAHRPGAMAGIGAGLGAAAGVGREALRKGDEPKNYLGAGLRGAALGGIAGGVTSGLGHAAHDTMLLNPHLSGPVDVAKETAKRMGQGVSNFAQRQFHGLTGYGSKDKAYLDRIGMMGEHAAGQKAKLLNLRMEDELSHHLKGVKEIKDPLDRLHGYTEHLQKQRSMGDALTKQVSALQSEGQAAQHLRDLGMTSVPGAVKGMVTNPREASKALWQHMRQGGALGVAAGTVIPGAIAARDLSRGDESAMGGRTMGEKALRAGATIGGGMLLGGVPMLPGAIAGGVAESAAGRLGRVITKPKPLEQGLQVAPAAVQG